MKPVELIGLNENNVHLYGMCGYKNVKQEGYRLKLEWLKERFAEGMTYLILNSAEDGPVGGIEYVPGENAWRPVEANGYLFIQCVYIMSKKYRGAGYGELMINACLDDARAQNRSGAAIVVREGTWMPGKELFLKMGFTVTDTFKPDFSLMTLKLKPEAPDPVFPADLARRPAEWGQGLRIITSHQCPYTEKAVREISEAAETLYHLKPEITILRNSGDARRSPGIFGVFSILYNGQLAADHPVSRTRFKNIMDKLLKGGKKP